MINTVWYVVRITFLINMGQGTMVIESGCAFVFRVLFVTIVV